MDIRRHQLIVYDVEGGKDTRKKREKEVKEVGIREGGVERDGDGGGVREGGKCSLSWGWGVMGWKRGGGGERVRGMESGGK